MKVLLKTSEDRAYILTEEVKPHMNDFLEISRLIMAALQAPGDSSPQQKDKKSIVFMFNF